MVHLNQKGYVFMTLVTLSWCLFDSLSVVAQACFRNKFLPSDILPPAMPLGNP
jgi:hypothetical protein